MPPVFIHSDQSSASTKMAEALRNLQHAMTQTHDAIFIADGTGVITRVNPSFEKLTGYTALECVAKDFSMLIAGGVECEQYQKIWQEIFQQRAFSGILTLQTKDGRARLLEITIASVRNRRGEATSIVGTGRAIDGAANGEKNGVAADEKIARTAHDVENTLTVALVNLDLTNDLLPIEHPARSKVEKAKAAIRRAGRFVRELANPPQAAPPDNGPSAEFSPDGHSSRRTHSRVLMEAEEHTTTARAKTILLVEDEHMIRESTAEFLSGAGYNVVAASTAEEALECLRKQPGTVDLMVSDLLLPKMSGSELADAVRSEHPNVKVLFISGHPLPSAMGRPLAEGSFVAKPFSFPALHARIREMLACAEKTQVTASAH